MELSPILSPDIEFFENFFPPKEADGFFETLLKETSWRHEAIILYGKKILQPRLTAWYGDKGKVLRYSGTEMHPEPWTPTLLEIKKRVEKISPIKFNSVLLNQYRNEKDSVGWHRDNERELGSLPVIASISLGASREFQMRRYKEKDLKKSILLTNGSILIMKGTTQQIWEHQIPKRSKPLGPRINLTFRNLIA